MIHLNAIVRYHSPIRRTLTAAAIDRLFNKCCRPTKKLREELSFLTGFLIMLLNCFAITNKNIELKMFNP